MDCLLRDEVRFPTKATTNAHTKAAAFLPKFHTTTDLNVLAEVKPSVVISFSIHLQFSIFLLKFLLFWLAELRFRCLFAQPSVFYKYMRSRVEIIGVHFFTRSGICNNTRLGKKKRRSLSMSSFKKCQSHEQHEKNSFFLIFALMGLFCRQSLPTT